MRPPHIGSKWEERKKESRNIRIQSSLERIEFHPCHPWPDLGGRLKADLGLISSCCEGHEDSQQPNVPFDGIVGMVTMVCKALDRPKPNQWPF